MRAAVIVSSVRTSIGNAYLEAFNDTPAQTLAAHAIRAAVERAGIEGGEMDDVVLGRAMQEGAQAGAVRVTSRGLASGEVVLPENVGSAGLPP